MNGSFHTAHLGGPTAVRLGEIERLRISLLPEAERAPSVRRIRGVGDGYRRTDRLAAILAARPLFFTTFGYRRTITFEGLGGL